MAETVRCSACNGSGRITCNGNGGGSGVYYHAGKKEAVRCSKCAGSGKTSCSFCGGTGEMPKR